MIEMMKRDYYINQMYFLFVVIFIPFIYVFNLSPLFIFIGMMIGSIFNLFYYDNHNHTNRFIVSMPVNRNVVVLSRYLSIMIVTIILLIYLWIIDYLAHTFILPFISDWIPAFEIQPVSLILLMFTFFAVVVITSVSIPIYYYFQSFMKSLIAQGVLFVIGIIGFTLFILFMDYIPEKVILLVLDLIDFQPIVSFIVCIAICLTVSYKVSTFIFAKRDIV